MEMEEYRAQVMRGERRTRVGSALILAVVLTSLLAVIGTMFLMAARVDSIGTSAISENRDLNSAVEAVVANISQELSQDVPGMKSSEYYDYPGDNDGWLASLEPYKDGTDYEWRQISDVTGFLNDKGFSTQNVNVKPVGLSTTVYVRDYPTIRVDSEGRFLDDNGNIATDGVSADADGDGIADSKWIELDGMTSSKGQSIYAAIRVIDNGGMLNVNTAYEFDPNGATASEIDGSRLPQVHMLNFVKGVSDDVIDLHRLRCDNANPDLLQFDRECAVRLENPDRTSVNYLAYDIGDELELRNRFLLDGQFNIARVESALPVTLTYPKGKTYGNRFAPIDTSGDFDDWKKILDSFDPNDSYDFRHLLTTYNTDRIINPGGEKMLSVNDPNVAIGSLYRTIKSAIGPNDPNSEDAAAQIAVDLIDYRDNDSNVSYYDVNGVTYYGFERPCVYISELSHNFVRLNIPSAPIGFTFRRSYGIELYKPYNEDDYPQASRWRLFIDNSGGSAPNDVNVSIDWSGTKRFHVIRWEDPNALLNYNFDSNDADANRPSPTIKQFIVGPSTVIFDDRSTIRLQRLAGNGAWITVDQKRPPAGRSGVGGWLQFGSGPQSVQRDIALHKCIRRLWGDATDVAVPTLGRANTYTNASTEMIQAHPANRDFTNVGEITKLFHKDVYDDAVIRGATEDEVRFDLTDPDMREVFKYLTRFDPSKDFDSGGQPINNDGDEWDNEIDPDKTPEFKIAGRININTAPWYVIARLPWVTDRIAQAIAAYRDKTSVSGGPDFSVRLGQAGFRNIGQLSAVVVGDRDYSVDYYSRDSNDLDEFPDLTYSDGAPDDFEERDVIFARMSDLATVRSDVFTAYILVRIGVDGPQRRALAILDRSNVYPDPSGGVVGRVKVAALHPVPDPR